MKFTVLGSTGFIGSHLVKYIKSEKIECFTPNLRKESISKISNLGHVIYAIGVSDFINHPYDTIEAHVCKLNEVLLNRNFESLTYFSSGRFYYNEKNTSENLTLTVNPLDSDQLYNISKLLGESLCNSSKNSNIKITDARRLTLHGNDIFEQVKDKNFANVTPSEILNLRAKNCTPSLISMYDKVSVKIISDLFKNDIILYDKCFNEKCSEFIIV